MGELKLTTQGAKWQQVLSWPCSEQEYWFGALRVAASWPMIVHISPCYLDWLIRLDSHVCPAWLLSISAQHPPQVFSGQEKPSFRTTSAVAAETNTVKVKKLFMLRCKAKYAVPKWSLSFNWFLLFTDFWVLFLVSQAPYIHIRRPGHTNRLLVLHPKITIV